MRPAARHEVVPAPVPGVPSVDHGFSRPASSDALPRTRWWLIDELVPAASRLHVRPRSPRDRVRREGGEAERRPAAGSLQAARAHRSLLPPIRRRRRGEITSSVASGGMKTYRTRRAPPRTRQSARSSRPTAHAPEPAIHPPACPERSRRAPPDLPDPPDPPDPVSETAQRGNPTRRVTLVHIGIVRWCDPRQRVERQAEAHGESPGMRTCVRFAGTTVRCAIRDARWPPGQVARVTAPRCRAAGKDTTKLIAFELVVEVRVERVEIHRRRLSRQRQDHVSSYPAPAGGHPATSSVLAQVRAGTAPPRRGQHRRAGSCRLSRYGSRQHGSPSVREKQPSAQRGNCSPGTTCPGRSGRSRTLRSGLQPKEKIGGQHALGRPERGCVPFVGVGIGHRDERGLAAHGQPHVAGRQIARPRRRARGSIASRHRCSGRATRGDSGRARRASCAPSGPRALRRRPTPARRVDGLGRARQRQVSLAREQA